LLELTEMLVPAPINAPERSFIIYW